MMVMMLMVTLKMIQRYNHPLNPYRQIKNQVASQFKSKIPTNSSTSPILMMKIATTTGKVI